MAVDIPSYQVGSGDRVSLRLKSRKNVNILEALKNATARGRVSYVTLEEQQFTGMLMSVPERGEIPINVQEQLVVELYSK
jgi:small subunit ribosomal protein S4